MLEHTRSERAGRAARMAGSLAGWQNHIVLNEVFEVGSVVFALREHRLLRFTAPTTPVRPSDYGSGPPSCHLLGTY